MKRPSLFSHYMHLDSASGISVEPPFTGMSWYGDYMARHAADGTKGRLVSLYTFSESWDSWEMHPAGDEAVICVAGAITLHQEHADGRIDTLTLGAGDYAVNPPGTWHTADVEGECTALFITAGFGTEHRPR